MLLRSLTTGRSSSSWWTACRSSTSRGQCRRCMAACLCGTRIPHKFRRSRQASPAVCSTHWCIAPGTLPQRMLKLAPGLQHGCRHDAECVVAQGQQVLPHLGICPPDHGACAHQDMPQRTLLVSLNLIASNCKRAQSDWVTNPPLVCCRSFRFPRPSSSRSCGPPSFTG